MEVSRTEYTIKRAKELYDNGEDIFIAIDKAREKYEEMIKSEYLSQCDISNRKFYSWQSL